MVYCESISLIKINIQVWIIVKNSYEETMHNQIWKKKLQYFWLSYLLGKFLV